MGRLKDQQDPAASWVLRQQPHCSPDSPDPPFLPETEKSASLGNSLSNITVNVVNIPLLTAIRKT